VQQKSEASFYTNLKLYFKKKNSENTMTWIKNFLYTGILISQLLKTDIKAADLSNQQIELQTKARQEFIARSHNIMADLSNEFNDPNNNHFNFEYNLKVVFETQYINSWPVNGGSAELYFNEDLDSIRINTGILGIGAKDFIFSQDSLEARAWHDWEYFGYTQNPLTYYDYRVDKGKEPKPHKEKRKGTIYEKAFFSTTAIKMFLTGDISDSVRIVYASNEQTIKLNRKWISSNLEIVEANLGNMDEDMWVQELSLLVYHLNKKQIILDANVFIADPRWYKPNILGRLEMSKVIYEPNSTNNK
jgi:hypothetical protein